METEKIVVLRDHDTSGRSGELKLLHIGRAEQARIRSGSQVDVAPPEASRDVG
jgi:hypothetical protein